jgi:pimeloyl-ACP methyl ester carboxylesterase
MSLRVTIALLFALSQSTFRIGGGEEMPAEHGSFQVPAIRARPESGIIVLRYVRFRSTSATPGAPIVFLAGGPGDAATRAFAGMPRTFLDMLLQIADVVTFDQRGTGRSEPRALCPPGAPAPLDAPANPHQMAAAMRERLRDCIQTQAGAGVDAAGFTTEQSADDVEALRVALDVPRVTLLAGSYGTHVALSVARRHPRSVDKMALFGVEGPNDTFKLPANVDAVLEQIDREHAGLIESIRMLRKRLREKPWTKVLPNGQSVTVGEWDLQRRIAESLDTTREIASMAAAVSGMMSGDYSDLVRWAIPFRAARPLNLMNIAMDCASFATAERLKLIASQEPASLLGSAMNFPLPYLCDVEGLPRLPDSFRQPVSTGVPALLVSGMWDGRTPPANALAVASSMSAAELVTIPKASHGLFQEPEAVAALRAFLTGR